MELIDNISRLLGDDLKRALKPGARLKVAASCFSMYAFEALKAELEQVDELHFIFTSPTFMAEEVTDKIRKERKEFHIPKLNRERSLYGSEFEIHLRNKLTQRAIARECADWLRRKARFMSNRTQAPMQPFACVEPGDAADARTVYMPLHGFTAVDLGYQPGNAVSNLVNKMDEPPFTATYLQLFDQIWNDAEKVEDVTGAIVDHIATVYKENSPESIYFLMLYNIFNEFLPHRAGQLRAAQPGATARPPAGLGTLSGLRRRRLPAADGRGARPVRAVAPVQGWQRAHRPHPDPAVPVPKAGTVAAHVLPVGILGGTPRELLRAAEGDLGRGRLGRLDRVLPAGHRGAGGHQQCPRDGHPGPV
jgi:hypothetical protein